MLIDRQLLKMKPGMHADTGGLYLRVSPKGKKAWVRRSQKDGKDSWSTIGTYPGMTLADARRAVQQLPVEKTMTSAVEEYMTKLSVERPEQVAALLDPLTTKTLSVSKTDLVGMLHEVAKTGPVHANRMLTRWKDFFNYCEQCGWITANPITSVQRKFIGGKESARSRTLNDKEITAIDHPALWFILLTGLRPSEALWVLRTKQTEGIPTKENKTPPIHWVPRTPLVCWALRQTFPTPASHLTLSNYLRRKRTTWTPHDLRRTFSTKLNDLGVAPHIVEKMLDHKLPGVMAIYNHAEYRAERRTAQRRWDRWLLSLRKKTPEG